jgi:hypothetical protein
MRLLSAIRAWFRRPLFDVDVIRRADLQPGDVLVLRSNGRIPPAAIRSVYEQVRGLAEATGAPILLLQDGQQVSRERLSRHEAPDRPADAAEPRCDQSDNGFHGDLVAVLPQPIDREIERSA